MYWTPDRHPGKPGFQEHTNRSPGSTTSWHAASRTRRWRSIPTSATYLTCTCLAALACAYAVYLNLTHARLVIDTAHRLDIPVSLMVPFGILLGSAGAGLLVGLVVPGLGTAAAAGLVAYFVIALAAHLRARNFQLVWPLIYLLLAAAALATGLAYHGALG